ncbi:copper homeostasis membrane protein CopD [Ralstonia solanacearum]|uniref:Copper resistance protein CopD n=1 Tax=Ralstonia solanacearum TaxID=305 RepID=A0AAD0SAZ8_RALSL|nr:copper homeostasis membrane protein CopD [Ralstonia solanacearum]AXV83667.1 copper resistance protein CopD [Ralstonia solanacearum]AXW54799.1 copper resistance protein CopD [Ralstonia solanacearum]
MADDGLSVALRFALYLDLMLVFGVALFGLRALRPEDRAAAIARRYVRVIVVSVAAGIVLSLWSILVMAKAMTGAAEYAELTRHVFGMILTATAFGLAWTARMAALAACLSAVAVLRRRPTARFAVLAALGATALATLTWSGHGAMDDGARGVLHAASDIAHLLAAGAWVGALVAFVLLSSARQMSAPGAVAMLSRASNGFAGLGTVIVATLAVTGVANYLFIVGPTVDGLITTAYGGLLLAKLALVALMLGLAAANRFRLSPRLAAAVRSADEAGAVRALRASLVTEACLGVLILGLVAWLGGLSPAGA